jgi:hypothetical protein
VAVVEVQVFLVALEAVVLVVETMVGMALLILAVAEGVLMLAVQQAQAVQALSFFVTPVQFNISQVAQ